MNKITSASLLNFLDWIGTQDWNSDTFFQMVYQWFTYRTCHRQLPSDALATKDVAFLSESESYLAASGYFITEPSAASYGMLWNRIILKTSCLHHYRSITKEEIQQTLDQIKQELSQSSANDRQTDQLISNFSSYDKPCIGRDDLLEKIHDALSFENHAVFLHGMAGIGKSTLAKVYASRYASFYDTIIFATYESDLLHLVISDTDIPVSNLTWKPCGKRGEKGRYFRKKLNLLQTLVNERTLIIIDNFDTTNDKHLADMLSLPCKMIFTTRTLPQIFGVYGIPVSALSRQEELRSLFYLYHPSESFSGSDVIDSLLEMLHGHTLTIQLTASYLETTGQRAENLLTQNMDFLHETDITKQLTELFCIAKLTTEERRVLRYLSIMPISGITMNQFSEYCHFTKMSVLNSLIQRNMIQHELTQNRISLHPLLCKVVHSMEKPTYSNVWSYAVTLCEFGRQTWWLPYEKTKEYREYLFALIHHIAIPEANRMEHLIYLVDGCWQLGNFSLAERFGHLLHDCCLETFGPNHVMTARIRHSLGTVYYNWGKLEKALDWYTLAYSDYQNSPNPDIYLYSILLMKMGRTMRLSKNWEKSRQFLQNAISFLQNHLNEIPDMPATQRPKLSWLVALCDIYTECILLSLDQKRALEAWEFCERYEIEFEQLRPDREASLWALYYYKGLVKTSMMESAADAKQKDALRCESNCYLNQALDYVKKYQMQNASAYIKVLEALEQITEVPRVKQGFRKEIEQLKLGVPS